MPKKTDQKKVKIEPSVPQRSGPTVWALDTILSDVRSRLSGCTAYLPMHEEKIGSRNYYTVLYDNYFFVQHNGAQDFEEKLRRLRTSVIEGPLLSNGRITYKLGSFIEGLRAQALERATSYVPEVGEMVTCLHEATGRMDGLVMYVDPEEKIATVKIVMRSREIIASVKFSNIQRKEDDLDTTLEWMRALP